MKRAPQGRYTREFRQEAVKLVLEENLSLPEAGRRLSLPPSTLGYWVKLYKAGKLGRGQELPALDRRGDGAGPDEERTGGSEDGAGHPKKSSRVLCQGVAARYAMMKQLRLDLPHICPEPNVGRIGQWLLCLGGQAAEQASARGSTAGA